MGRTGRDIVARWRARGHVEDEVEDDVGGVVDKLNKLSKNRKLQSLYCHVTSNLKVKSVLGGSRFRINVGSIPNFLAGALVKSVTSSGK